MSIYTRTGDQGETGLFDGTRVSKSDPRVDAYGDVDETASALGIARAHLSYRDLVDLVEQLQRDLLALGAQLADPAHRIADRVAKVQLDEGAVARLESWIDRLDAELTPTRKFILAGGSPAGAALHQARAVCRRAERRVVPLGAGAVPPGVLVYLNRLSDLLFTLARVANARARIPDVEW